MFAPLTPSQRASTGEARRSPGRREPNRHSAQPDDPQFRQRASVSISDDEGVIGLPRVGIEALAEKWLEA